MATFDQLSAEQRAIVELVLERGKTYHELAGMLGMPEERVRELARDALVELAPVSVRGVEEDWRGQLADYVLGQQAGPEATATRGHLRLSEPARSWTRSLLDSLDQLYPNGSMPEIPGSDRGRRAPSGSGRSAAKSGFFGGLGVLGAVAAAVAAIVVLFAVFVWPIGVLGGDDDPAAEQTASDPSGQNAGQGQGEAAGAPAGIAIVVEQDGKRQLLVQAARLSPSGEREAYEVWLYNDQGDAKSLGGQVTDQQGNLQAIGAVPPDLGDYRFIDVSREPLDQERGHSGDSALRGPVPTLRRPQNADSAKKNEPVLLGQSVLAPPRG